MRTPFSPLHRRDPVCGGLAAALLTSLLASGAAAHTSKSFNELNLPR